MLICIQLIFFLSGKATTTNMTPSSFPFSVSQFVLFFTVKVKNKQTNKSTKHNETSGELMYRGTRDRTTISTAAVT